MTRLIAFTSFLALAVGPALAGDSVINVTSDALGAGSVIEVDCSTCPPLKPKKTGPDVHGVEVIEAEIGGKKKTVQTDNMMGGSAVRTVKASHSSPQFAGETVTHTKAGTTVASEHHGTIHIQPGAEPIVADSGTTFEGGGEFNVEEVGENNIRRDGVDGASQTSSVNMNDAQHDNAGQQAPEGGQQPHNNGPEIIELRPTQ
ncbi:plant virulence effector HPE1-like domain-containing protein [Hoeflea poritis]|uniref:Plant virulence effector HPE1-like domain-containing protein n=1 Tax=Hoeflea poritis TaxID=2993659 RepID=A0ABT4VJI5_9HYPH|nr:plant virulence effector HPE1-like domain-containing protein [Hoeflea poritis]MDA4844865.1 plant virulence effector HPE1-like domain-containing protein [Hoeflea poritis]